VCDLCVDAGNDTTFTPGRSGMGTDIAERAAFPAIGFVGPDSVLRCARTAAGSWQIQVVQPEPRRVAARWHSTSPASR
jgi:hypothetical protein